MARISIVAAGLLLAITAVAVDAQSRGGVGVEQVSKTSQQRAQDRLGVPPVRAASSRAGVAPPSEVTARAPAQITRQMYEACRAAQIGGPAPANVDCPAVLRAVAEAPRPTPEGTLLRLLGQRSNVTTPSQQRVVRTSDANVVAQQVANGDATQGDAAAIAARQRGGGGAPPPPR